MTSFLTADNSEFAVFKIQKKFVKNAYGKSPSKLGGKTPFFPIS